MKCALRPLTISERALQNYRELSYFIGYHLICHSCIQSFRCFRWDERFCGCCKERTRHEA